MRHTAQPLTAGDWHGFPVLFERALQRKARCMASFEEEGSVVAVIGDLYGSLAAAHHGIRDDGLVGVHGDVLHRDLLLAFTAVTVERLGKPRERSGSLVGECQVSCTHFDTLFRDPGPPVEVERCGVRRDHLGAQHAFHRVLGIDTDLPSQSAERTLDGRRRHRTAGSGSEPASCAVRCWFHSSCLPPPRARSSPRPPAGSIASLATLAAGPGFLSGDVLADFPPAFIVYRTPPG